MNRTAMIRLLLAFFVFIVLHIFIFRHLVLWEIGFVFAYIGFLLLIPIETNLMLAMIWGFCIGFGVDMFYDSPGVHAAACVCSMYLRPFLIRFYTPLGGYDDKIEIGISTMGWQWMITYVLTITALNALLVFTIDGGGFYLFHYTLIKTIFTSIISSAFILLLYKISIKEN